MNPHAPRSFLRFPGGCYVEGDWLRNAVRWKESVGAVEARTGHLNGVWGYWSSDGLGVFEYMQLCEVRKWRVAGVELGVGFGSWG